MPKISSKATLIDKLEIYSKTSIKILRGLLKGIGLKKRKFPIFIGEHVDISHKQNIYCGKNGRLQEIT